MSCIRSCYEKDSPNFGHEDCGTCIHGDRQPQQKQEPVAWPDDFELLPVDPTPEMKSAAIEVELFDHDTGKDYVLSWEEAEQIYSAMLNAAPTPPQRQPLTDEQIVAINDKHYNIAYRDFDADIAIARAIEAAHGIKEKNT